MLSCDTAAVAAAYSIYGQNMFAKNSDRPTAEAQMLRVYPAMDYAADAFVQMTDLSIPQTAHTYAVIGAQPYWIWGFEMGFNEMGLMIGNEAEGSKCAAETQTGILGMDLLRLALERASNCREGIEVITSMLKQYGQNANASPLRDRRYENTYLLVDKQEIWILETAGREWIAKQIPDKIGISNCYTLQDGDLCSEKLKETAYVNGWLAKDAVFDFAKAYSLPAIRQTLALPRMRRMNEVLFAQEKHDFASLKMLLCDHYEGTLIAPRFGKCMANMPSICMHMREWGDSETVGSLLCRSEDTLGIVARFAPAQPCQSVYLPVYMTGYLPQALQTAGKTYSEDSVWWKLRRLALAICIDEERFDALCAIELQGLQASLDAEAEQVEAQAKVYMQTGQSEEAFAVLNDFMDRAVDEAMRLADALYFKIREQVQVSGGIYGIQKDNIIQYCRHACLDLI